jgi:phosphoribosylamine--glycine ligase
LIIGGGGREHALAWSIRKNREVSDIYAVPGNAGISQIAECIPLAQTDILRLAGLAEEKEVDLTIVGPEIPLSLGIVNEFRQRGLAVFGPTREASKVEWSKAFAKRLMTENNIPTAQYETFSDPLEAKNYIRHFNRPVVIKADGLAAGKGVLLCPQVEDALRAIDQVMGSRVFGQAGQQVVVEELVSGEEASFLAFSDGDTILPMASAQDHKPIFDDDKGPNTGGMGAYSPAPVISKELYQKIMDRVMVPAVEGLNRLGIAYQGVLYAGLMIRNNEPIVLEFNARFGDPETQPILMRLETDLIYIIQQTIQKRLHHVRLDWNQGGATCVVLASQGYPGFYSPGKVITGLEEADQLPGVTVFHAGTAKPNGRIVTSGGRVLGVTALGETIADSISRAYAAVEKISFDGVYCRKDIGRRALRRTGQLQPRWP